MSDFDVSEMQIVSIKPRNGLVGFGSCVLNQGLYLGNLAIHSCPDGTFRIDYPTKKLANGQNIPCVHPINKDTDEIIRIAISNGYKKLIGII